jgi:hypothetical protein
MGVAHTFGQSPEAFLYPISELKRPYYYKTHYKTWSYNSKLFLRENLLKKPPKLDDGLKENPLRQISATLIPRLESQVIMFC